MTNKDRDELEDIIAAVRTPHAVADIMTAWEVKFTQDIRSRYAKWGTDIQVTDKQWNILRQIKEKIDDAN